MEQQDCVTCKHGTVPATMEPCDNCQNYRNFEPFEDEDDDCTSCEYGLQPSDEHPCSVCMNHSHYKLFNEEGESKMEKKKKVANPSVDQSESMTAVFDYINNSLFDSELPRPMIVFNRNPKVIGGYYAPDKWFSSEDASGVDEIAINANSMVEGDEIELMQVLVHEMTHQWQHHYGKPGRGGYHNREWADKCLAIGLKPMDVDNPDCETGDKINTVLIKGGKAMIALAEMPEDISIAFYAEVLAGPGGDDGKGKDGKPEPTPMPKPKSGSRTKYTCSVCGTNLWGKSDLKIMCVSCSSIFIETK